MENMRGKKTNKTKELSISKWTLKHNFELRVLDPFPAHSPSVKVEKKNAGVPAVA